MINLPAALIQELQNNNIVDVEQLQKAHLEDAITSVRINSKKCTLQFSNQAKVPWADHAFYLADRPFFAHDPLWHAGAYYVQEASSMFLEYAFKQCVNLSEDIKVLDLCAAPGGKSTLVADIISENSLLISNEVIGTRVAPLAENMMKWGRCNTWVSNNDPKQFTKLENYFDVILVDAPCSGSGLFRKDENYIAEWTAANVHLCAQRQQRILHDVMPALKPNGILIYMTCSFSTAENEDICDEIVEQFSAESITLEVPTDWGILKTISKKKQASAYRFFPNLLQGEGFFLACFRKMDDVDNAPDLKYFKKEKTDFNWLGKYVNLNNKTVMQEKELLFAMPNNYLDDYLYLSKNIKLVRKGTLLGKAIKQELIPEHDLAVSVHCAYQNTCEVTLTQALNYLKKIDFTLPEDCPKGWVILQYNYCNIGWIKNMGNRWNNYFPMHLRIRKM